jgi:3-hydroxyisobutyrate dehydrogenase-like beta-hydroxyacid dehydrogenase
MRVAFLGLGIMGKRMAANLVRAGHEVSVWNRTPKQLEGARTAVTPAHAARGAEVVWLCVSDTAAVEQVLFGINGVESVLTRGMLVVDSSTVSPSATLRFAERVRSTGADYADAPAIGSKAAADDATLVFIVGGSEDLIQRLHPLFGAMGKKVIRTGETGTGEATKLAINLQVALIFEAFAEGLLLATKLGVAPERLIEAIQASVVRSGVVDYKVSALLRRDFTPHLPLRLMRKDIRLMLDAAKEVQVKLPAVEAVQQVYERAAEGGLADMDYSAILEVLEKWAGVRIQGTLAGPGSS